MPQARALLSLTLIASKEAIQKCSDEHKWLSMRAWLWERITPLLSYDVGAGGLSNALPELVKDAGYGGKFELRQIENADPSMGPLHIWCCEAQEIRSLTRRASTGFSIASKSIPRSLKQFPSLLTLYRARALWVFGCWHCCCQRPGRSRQTCLNRPRVR